MSRCTLLRVTVGWDRGGTGGDEGGKKETILTPWDMNMGYEDRYLGTMVTACAQASQAYGYVGSSSSRLCYLYMGIYFLPLIKPGRNVHTLDTAHSPPPLDESLSLSL